jgi:hypothetical protein
MEERNTNRDLFEETDESDTEGYATDLEDRDDFGEDDTRSEDEPGDLEELEDFASDVQEMKDRNARMEKYAFRELSDTEASAFLDRELIDIDAIKAEINQFLQDRDEQREKISGMASDSAMTWQAQEDLQQRERRLHHKCSLLSVGLTMQKIGAMADDHQDMIYEAAGAEGDSLRRIRRQMRSLKPSQRGQMIEELLEEGEITPAEYQWLRAEYL